MPEGAGAERRLGPPERAALLERAHASLDHGLYAGEPLLPDPAGFAPALRQPGASFVTLRCEGRLRGCVGALEALRPLVVDVAHHAFGAAFRDPRFPAVTQQERPGLSLHVSVLSAPEALAFASEAELLAQLEPHVHGLVIVADGRSATFLPAVWEQLPDPELFLRELKRKAGLPAQLASGFRAARYSVTSIP